MPPGGEPLTDEEVGVFTDQVEDASNLIIEQLGLKEFERIGFRAWHLFPCDNIKESLSWLKELNFFQISEQFESAFSKDVESASLAAVFRGETNYRVALSQVERTAQVDVGQEILNVRASKLSRNQQKFFHEQLRVKKRLRANPDFAAMIDVDAFQDDPGMVASKEFITECMSQLTARIFKASK